MSRKIIFIMFVFLIMQSFYTLAKQTTPSSARSQAVRSKQEADLKKAFVNKGFKYASRNFSLSTGSGRTDDFR